MQVRTRKNYRVTSWSGGTTTEVFIYPENGDYAAREFAFRISSATVELDYSQFTSLPGVTRFISVLTGGLELSFNGGEKIKLAPYEVVEFKGDWNTESWGQATDFNLMVKKGTGCMEGMEIKGGQTVNLPEGHHVFYVGEGTVTLSIGTEENIISAGDSVYLQTHSLQKMSVTGDAKLMHCHVKEV